MRKVMIPGHDRPQLWKILACGGGSWRKDVNSTQRGTLWRRPCISIESESVESVAVCVQTCSVIAVYVCDQSG